MADIYLRRNLNDGPVPKNIAMSEVVYDTTAESVSGDVYWTLESDPTMEPQFLGSQVAGHDLVVPFDTKGQAIRLYLVSRTSEGVQSVTDIKDAVQIVFTPTADRGTSFILAVAGENLTERDLVNLYDDAGTLKARKADADDPTKPADGWANATTTSGDTVEVNLTSTLITGLSSLSIGVDYYLSATAGGITATAPSGSGQIVQRIGQSLSATVLSFERGEPVTLA